MRIVMAGTCVLFLAAAGRAEPPDAASPKTALQVVDEYDVAPQAVRMKPPVYPPRAFERGIEGTVLIEIVIDERGRVARAAVKQSIPELDAAALACVRKWRFRPARKNGKAVATTAQAPVTFRRSERQDANKS